MKGQVEPLLEKFRAFDHAPMVGSAADPAAPSGGAGEGDAAAGVESLAGIGGGKDD